MKIALLILVVAANFISTGSAGRGDKRAAPDAETGESSQKAVVKSEEPVPRRTRIESVKTERERARRAMIQEEALIQAQSEAAIEPFSLERVGTADDISRLSDLYNGDLRGALLSEAFECRLDSAIILWNHFKNEASDVNLKRDFLAAAVVGNCAVFFSPATEDLWRDAEMSSRMSLGYLAMTFGHYKLALAIHQGQLNNLASYARMNDLVSNGQVETFAPNPDTDLAELLNIACDEEPETTLTEERAIKFFCVAVLLKHFSPDDEAIKSVIVSSSRPEILTLIAHDVSFRGGMLDAAQPDTFLFKMIVPRCYDEAYDFPWLGLCESQFDEPLMQAGVNNENLGPFKKLVRQTRSLETNDLSFRFEGSVLKRSWYREKIAQMLIMVHDKDATRTSLLAFVSEQKRPHLDEKVPKDKETLRLDTIRLENVAKLILEAKGKSHRQTADQLISDIEAEIDSFVQANLLEMKRLKQMLKFYIAYGAVGSYSFELLDYCYDKRVFDLVKFCLADGITDVGGKLLKKAQNELKRVAKPAADYNLEKDLEATKWKSDLNEIVELLAEPLLPSRNPARSETYEFTYDRLLATRVEWNMFLVKWKSYPKVGATWEPREKIQETAPELLHEFENSMSQ